MPEPRNAALPGLGPARPAAAAAPPPPKRTGPDFVATGLKFGIIDDPDGGKAITFLFTDPEGHEVAIFVTNDDGVFVDELHEEFKRRVEQAMPPSPDVVRCAGCGVQIFGEVAKRGACLSCQPA